MLRLARWATGGLIAVLAAGWGVGWLAAPDPGDRAAALVRRMRAPGAAGAAFSLPAATGGPFSLVDTEGRPVTEQAFRGRWMLAYFGYAYCPDLCPTALQAMAEALDQLGPAAAQVSPVFITIDPARDTPAALGQYVSLFDPRLVGLTGSPAQVEAVERAYGISIRHVSNVSGADLIDHSTYVYLMAPDGSLRTRFPAGTDAASMTRSIAAAMAERG